MKNTITKFSCILFAMLLFQAPIFAQNLCEEDLRKGGLITNQNGAVPITPPTVKIKNTLGETVYVPLVKPFKCEDPTGLDVNFEKHPSYYPTKAGNCHAFSLYISQGGPYHSDIPFMVGGYINPINVVKNCQLEQSPALEDFKKLLRGFDEVASSKKYQAGTVIMFYEKETNTPYHSAVSLGSINGETWAHQVHFGGSYDSLKLSTLEALHSDEVTRYYRKKQNYSSNSSAGVFTKCSNIKKCEQLSSISVSGPSSFCTGTYQTFTAPSGYDTYEWILGAGLKGSSTSRTITVYANVDFSNSTHVHPAASSSIKVRVKKDCYHYSKLSSSKSVTIKGKVPVDAIKINASPENPMPHEYVYISRTEHGGVSGFQWFTNMTPVSGQGTNRFVARMGQYPGYIHVTVSKKCMRYN